MLLHRDLPDELATLKSWLLRLDQRQSKTPVDLIRGSAAEHDIQLQKPIRIRWSQACGAAMDRTDSTIDLTLNAAGLRLLLDAVTHELDRWSGGEPSEQDNLQEMKTLLTAALLECTFQDN